MTKEKVVEIKNAILFFFAQMLLYLIFALNYRAIAQGNYIWSVISDVIVASITFFIIRKIAKSEDSILLWIGYTVGSVFGTIFGIYISVLLLGK